MSNFRDANELDYICDAKSMSQRELESYSHMRKMRVARGVNFDHWRHKPYSIYGTRLKYVPQK